MPTSQYMISAPSSPKPFGDPLDDYYFYNHASAPSSPTRAAAIYTHFSTSAASSPAPFGWGDKPGGHTDPFDFAFDFSGQGGKGVLPPALATADQLFEAGKIRPLEPHAPTLHALDDDRRCERGCGKGEKPDSLLVEMEETTRGRGRERAPSSPSVSSTKSRRGARSLSPFRGEGVFLKTPNSSSPSTTTSSSTNVICGGSRRWKLRDLLLFRNGSEGRVIGRGSKDPLRKFTLLSPSLDKISRGEDSKSASFGSTRSNGSMEWGSKGGQVVSAHEIHYRENRSVSEEQKKKTPLPYHRHGLFGYLRFNPAIRCITRGFNRNSVRRDGRS